MQELLLIKTCKLSPFLATWCGKLSGTNEITNNNSGLTKNSRSFKTSHVEYNIFSKFW